MNQDVQWKVATSPYMPVELLKHHVLVGPEGCWRPMADGTFAMYPFEFTNWVEEELSWYDNCYLHAGLNPFLFFDVKGKELLNLYSAISINTFNVFPINKARHVVICDNDGKIVTDGIIVRRSEDEFITMCLPDPQMLNQMAGERFTFESEDSASTRFFFQLCGPRSLEVVEAATRSNHHGLKFMYAKDTSIAGKDVFILRTSMAGTLGYEIHGSTEDAKEVYEELLKVGKEFGICELGRHAYRNAHTEGSIPQIGTHWASPNPPFPIRVTGSLDASSPLVHRSPIDLGWENLIKFDHDFAGKEALEKELAGHHNSMVTLIWDVDDIQAVLRGAFDKENPVDHMDMVEDYDPVGGNNTIHLDAVYSGDALIGASSGRMLSPKTREMISLCTLDEDYAVEGKVVEVLWGTPGTHQMRIKATVSLFPYIKEGRNSDFDIGSIPMVNA